MLKLSSVKGVQRSTLPSVAHKKALSVTERGCSYFLELKTTAVRDIPFSNVNAKSVDAQIFQFFGRLLATPPAHGIYIKVGSKILVK